ncbi:MAG: hypothetical protein KIS64_09680 [Fimbriimonadaceae bacterium]|nr:hypothetical protein [Fimbriimonadaceae bacterium]
MDDVKIVFSRRAALKAAYRQGLDRAVRALAFELQGQAMDEMLRYPEERRPIDTGALRASGYVDTGDPGARSRALSDAGRAASRPGRKSGRPGKARFSPVPDPMADLEAAVVFGQEYAVFIELGTDRRPATPFLGPARETVSRMVDETVRRFVDAAVRGSG